ncbi:PTS system mannose/fructose/sorbose family transporter subunit IID [[Eubacterium] hominis]|uniref:PTS system mannose/fructose/sorbose family transporter subunit IID n=1 Tax=[Eubacterium] hominis TaxID=2764325 RepID=UPI003A4DD17F
MSRQPVLTKKDLRQCGRRWLLGPSTFNYGTQMAPTVVYSEMKALRKIYPNDEDYIKSLKNQFKYFNATPPVCPFLLGATLAMEDKEGLDALDAVQDLKVSLMGPISGIGDTVMWALIPTIFGSIAAYMGQEGNPIGLVLYVCANLVIFFGKIFWWNTGYTLGTKIITTLSDKLAAFTEAASVLGLTVVGALIPTTVVIKTALTFSFNDVSMGVQEGILDGIFPSILPIVATIIVYKLIKKRVSLTKIILGIIVLSWLGAASGILGV